MGVCFNLLLASLTLALSAATYANVADTNYVSIFKYGEKIIELSNDSKALYLSVDEISIPEELTLNGYTKPNYSGVMTTFTSGTYRAEHIKSLTIKKSETTPSGSFLDVTIVGDGDECYSFYYANTQNQNIKMGQGCAGQKIALLSDLPSDFPAENNKIKMTIFEMLGDVPHGAGFFTAYLVDGKIDLDEYSFPSHSQVAFEKVSNSHLRFGLL